MELADLGCVSFTRAGLVGVRIKRLKALQRTALGYGLFTREVCKPTVESFSSQYVWTAQYTLSEERMAIPKICI